MYFLIALAALGLASIFDLKYREVPAFVTYSLLAAGLALHAAESYTLASADSFLTSLFMLVLCFSFAYLLYKVGFWAGGDVKLFTALGAMVPTYGAFTFFPFWVLLLSFFVAFPFAIVYVSYFFMARKKLRAFFIKELKKSALSSFFSAASILAAYGLFSITDFWPLLLTAPLFYFMMMKQKITVFLLAITYATGLTASATYFAYSFAFSFVLLLGFACLKIARKEILQDTVNAKDLKEGMILAYNILLQKGKPVFVGGISPEKAIAKSLASGLTPAEIFAIRKHGIKKVEIKKSLPFVPLLFGSMVLLAFFENFLKALLFS